MNPKAWTDDEITRLRDLARSGATAHEASEALGRPIQSVRKRARRHGYTLKSALGHVKFTAEEDAQIVAAVEAGIKQRQIAADMGRPYWSVRNRIDVLRLRGLMESHLGPVDDDTPTEPERPRPVQDIERLSQRHGERLVTALCGVRRGQPGAHERLSDIAARHGVPIQRARFLWHQVAS